MYDRLADLPIVVDDYALSAASLEVSSDFTRVSTEIALSGEGATGRGEDVGYEADDQRRFVDSFADGGLDLAGEYTLDSFSDRLDDVDLFPEPPERDADRHYRRWGFEAAALDLALRQADTDLASALDRDYDPVSFVVSTRLESAERLDEIRAVDPDAEFKLDPTADWGEDLVAAVQERGGVRVLDLKGHYEGTEVDNEPDPELYRRVVEAFPDAVVEDPRITDETRPVIDEVRDRVSWDAPITGVESVESLPFEPRWLNVKPSRFGTLESLLETIAYCEARDIQCYGGGQFELGVGREQIQLLASLCYPDAPNDVAPGGYNAAELPAELPTSPLSPPSDPVGFRR
jgi:L-alanine-DL-glutamate epimerase-like enolase superfamily enzyme